MGNKPGSVKRTFSKKVILIFLLAILSVVFCIESRQLFITQNLKKVERDFDSIRMGMLSYGVDFCGVYFPADTTYRREDDPVFPLTFETDNEFIQEKLKKKSPEGYYSWQTITTPVAYLSSVPYDPFKRGRYYGYTVWNIHDHVPTLGILHSPGPDKKDDIDLLDLRNTIDKFLRKAYPGGYTHELGLIGRSALRNHVNDYLYDPSNGLISRGDLIRLIDGSGNQSGWRIKNEDLWRTKNSIANLPLFNDDLNDTTGVIWNSWKKLPPPDSVAEYIFRDRIITIPNTFLAALQNELYYKRFNPDGSLNSESIDSIKTIIESKYAEILKSPRLLSMDEQKSFSGWRTYNSAEWKRIEEILCFNTTSTDNIKTEDLFILLPTLGKAVILLALSDITANDFQHARMRLTAIEDLLKYLTKKYGGLNNRYERIIIEELTGLCKETRDIISSVENK